VHEDPPPDSPAPAAEARTEPSGGLFALRDRDPSVQRVRLMAVGLMLVLVLGVGVVTRSPWQVMLSVTDTLLSGDQEGPNLLQAAFLVGRYALLGIVLCAIVLTPGVGPIPVALGLSVLVIAILLEAILQLFRGASGRP
jgi:hypothetical protein